MRFFHYVYGFCVARKKKSKRRLSRLSEFTSVLLRAKPPSKKTHFKEQRRASYNGALPKTGRLTHWGGGVQGPPIGACWGPQVVLWLRITRREREHAQAFCINPSWHGQAIWWTIFVGTDFQPPPQDASARKYGSILTTNTQIMLVDAISDAQSYIDAEFNIHNGWLYLISFYLCND